MGFKALKIGVDVDGVVAAHHAAWLDRYNAIHGTLFTEHDLTQWEFWKDLGCEKEAILSLYTADIYEAEVKPIGGAVEAVKAIEALGHKVYFVTSCYSDVEYKAKLQWLKRWGLDGRSSYGVGSWAGYTSKANVPVDWLIDDHIGNLQDFPGYRVLVTQPHNRNHIFCGKRVKHLRDVVPLLRYEKEVEQEVSIYGKLPRPKSITPLDAINPTELELKLMTEQPVSKPGWGQDLTQGGVKYDTGKLRFDLIPVYPLSLLAETYTVGSVKYDDDNWRKGMSVKRSMAAAHRHLAQFEAGEDWDAETGMHHLAAVGFNLFTAMEVQKTHPEFDDRPHQAGLVVAQPLTTLRRPVAEYLEKVAIGAGKPKRP